MNVSLTGFMGAGKTSTGRSLARLLRLPFVDVDAEIQRRHGTISAIFEQQGEAVFRLYESAVIAECAASGPRVIAVGGGAVTSEDNRRHLRVNGVIVYLAVSPETAFRRVVRRQHRPLLGSQPDLGTVRRLLEEREAAYADNDLTIHVDRKTPAIAAKIIARWYGDRIKQPVR